MKAQTLESYQERILRVLIHIQHHLDQPLSLDDLAEVAHFSPFHFHRVFRGMVGESVKEHLRRLRLERAAARLRSTEASIVSIALDAGYESHESFTRAFTALFGTPPSQFRKEKRQESESHSPSEVHYSPNGQPSFTPAQQGRRLMDVSIRRIERLRVVFVRHVGPYNEVGVAWNRLCTWAGPKGLLGPNVQMLGVSYDDPEITPPERLRYDAAIVVPDGIGPEGDIGIQEVGEGDYASATHCGPYEKLFESYAALCGQWAPANGREFTSGPALEFYLNSPESTPPAELRTQICMPLT